jgi:hypothetical protein
MTPPTTVRYSWNVFTEPLVSNDRGIYKQTHRLTFDTIRTTWITTGPTMLLSRVFVDAGTCSQSRFLATIGGYTYRHTD